jgi:hypothetical protein
MISQESQTFISNALGDAVTTIKQIVLREDRGRLYYCSTPPAGLPQFVCIFWDRAPGQNNILYANDGQTQADHWNSLYYQTADTTAQAIKAEVSPAQFQTLVDFATGKDSSFKNKLAQA